MYKRMSMHDMCRSDCLLLTIKQGNNEPQMIISPNLYEVQTHKMLLLTFKAVEKSNPAEMMFLLSVRAHISKISKAF